jgi:hypothetical protein
MTVHNRIGIAIFTNNVNPAVSASAIYIYCLLRGQSEIEAEKIYNTLMQETLEIIGQFKCDLSQFYGNRFTTEFDGTYINNKYGSLIIKNNKIKIGKLAPISYKYNGKTIGFTAYDVNNQPLVSLITLIYNKNKKNNLH